MNIDFSEEENAFRLEVRDWIAENLPQELKEKVRKNLRLSKNDLQSWAKILGTKGWLAWRWPSQFSGLDWSVKQRHIFEEECAMADAPQVVPFGPFMVAPVIMAFGTPEQQERFLPGIASGEVWWSQGYSEPGAGSDLASIKTRAERKTTDNGEVYVVNGQKTWTTLGQHGDWIFCLVRTKMDGKPQAGISFLLIDMTTPGITVRPIITLDGDHEVNEIFFDNVEVPIENLIGEENKGWTYTKYLLAHERTAIANVPLSKRMLQVVKEVATAEGVYNEPRFRDQIAELEVDLIALEMMVLRVLSDEEGGNKSMESAGLLKIRGSEIQQKYTELLMLAAGPMSAPYLENVLEGESLGDFEDAQSIAPLAGAYFNYRKTSIYGGSNEVQKNIVAQTLLR